MSTSTQTPGALDAARSSYAAAKSASGWRSWCRNSPKPPPAFAAPLANGEGWEKNGNRGPEAGYEYGVVPTCGKRGFKGEAAADYYSVWRRKVGQA